jgi:spore germination protein KB
VTQNDSFGSWSLAAATATVLLAVPFHPIIGYTALRAGATAAWLAVLMAGIVAVALYWLVAASLGALPNGGLISMARVAAGAPAAIITGLLVCSYLVLYSGFVLRRTAEMAVTSIYPHTPQTFPIVALAIAILYSTYGGLNGLVRLFQGFLPFLVLAILVILVGTVAWGEVTYLFPFWGPGPGTVAARSIKLMDLYSPAMLFLLVAAGQLRDRRRLWRAGVVTLGASTVAFVAILVVVLMTYPLPLAYSVTFPLHELSRLVIGGRFFERVEAVWVLFWFLGTACHVSAVLFTAAKAYADAFRMRTHRTAVLPLVALTLVISMFPRDVGESISWHEQEIPFAIGIGFGLPMVLALLATWRRRWAGRAG